MLQCGGGTLKADVSNRQSLQASSAASGLDPSTLAAPSTQSAICTAAKNTLLAGYSCTFAVHK